MPHRGVARATPRGAQSEERRQQPPLPTAHVSVPPMVWSSAIARICTGRRKSPVSLKADWAGLKPIPRGTLPRAADYATDYAGFSARACTSSQQHRAAGGRQLTYGSAWARCLGEGRSAGGSAARRALGGHSAGNGAAAHHGQRHGHQPPPHSSASKPVDASSRHADNPLPEMPL